MRERSEVAREITAEVEQWWARFNAAKTVGLTDEEATTFATDGDMDQLVKLVEAGCDARTIASIVA